MWIMFFLLINMLIYLFLFGQSCMCMTWIIQWILRARPRMHHVSYHTRLPAVLLLCSLCLSRQIVDLTVPALFVF